MKSYLVTFFMCSLINLSVFSQNIGVGDVVILNNSVPIIDKPIAIYSDEVKSDLTLKYLEGNVKFKVLKISDTTVELMALPFEVKSQTQRAEFLKTYPDERLKSDYYNDKVYTISLKDFIAFATAVDEKDRLSIGLLTLPFKARPQEDFSFDTEFNLSTTLNIRLFDLAKSSLNYQLGAGIGSVNLNNTNAAGLESEDAQQVATLTFFNGLMLQYKKVQVGFYLGVDQINNQKKNDWVSNGNIWLGFGIGYDLFNISLSKSDNTQ